MSATALALVLMIHLPAAQPGTAFVYEGEIAAVKGEADAPGKTFVYHVIVAGPAEKGTRLLWTVQEKGHGGWPWPDQFGEVVVDEHGRAAAGHFASLMYDHEDGYTVVPLLPPTFTAPKKLADGLKWSENRLQYEVTGSEKTGRPAAWVVDARSLIGHKRTVHVGKEDQQVVFVEETVFMGPGKEHAMDIRLANRSQLPAAQLAATVKAHQALSALLEKLEHRALSRRAAWNEEQLAQLKEALPEILQQAKDTPLAKLALQAAGDAKLKEGLAGTLKKLREEYVGKNVPQFKLSPASLAGKPITDESLKGKVSVLHFWSYQDAPLVEPYGQIGYLDFLHRKRKDDVQIYGVMVDDRLARRSSRPAALRSVRKLLSFMNLSYPVLLDESEVLSQFGDPTRLGLELPLFLVVNAQGKIVHYHAGLYEVQAERGLVELDKAVEQALKK